MKKNYYLFTICLLLLISHKISIAKNWAQIQKIVASDLGMNNQFDNATISENSVFIGTNSQDKDATEGNRLDRVEAAFFYKKIGLGHFLEMQKVVTNNLSCTTDSLALVALYNSTNGGAWTNSWTLTDPINTWHGIVTNNGCVTAIRLSNNNLIGSIPLEIGNLSSLQYLHLFNNQLTGAIPAEIGNLIDLEEFICSNNGLTGSIPKEIGNLTKLVFLSLGSNSLTGSIPKEIGNLLSCWHFYLNNNQLSGCFPESLIPFCDFPFKDFSANPGLPGGGDFDAFCANQTGICTSISCPMNLSFTSTISDGLHQAVNIMASGSVSAIGDVIFVAKENITLQPGFNVAEGGNFLTKIENCTATILNENPSVITSRVTRNTEINTPQLNLRIKPNPLKDHAVINYNLPIDKVVSLSISNLQGKSIKVILDKVYQKTGEHAVPIEAIGLTKGLYLVHLQTKEQIETRKIIVLE